MEQGIHELSKDIAYEVFGHFTKHTAQAVFIVDLHSLSVVYTNPPCRQLLEVRRHHEKIHLDSLIQTLHDEDKVHVIEKIKIHLKGNEVRDLEFRIISPGGRIKWICLSLFFIDENGKRSKILGFAEDISLRKEYELHLFKNNSKKNSILNILSHELRGPLSNISLISEMLKEEHRKGIADGANRLTDMIERTCMQALEMINQYLNKEFLESANIEIKKSRVEIVERVFSIIETWKVSHSELNRNFRLESYPNDKIWIEVDDVKLFQTINNLLSNAIKFTHEGGSIAIKLQEDRSGLLITFQDDGIGIPKKLQPFLFDEFTQARRKGLKGEKTVGLGMSISKKMVELHGGKIWFESEEKVGTTFFIHIPKS